MALGKNFNPRNTTCMSVVKIFSRLILEQISFCPLGEFQPGTSQFILVFKIRGKNKWVKQPGQIAKSQLQVSV